MAGHVFIVRGDLRKLACDAWLLPSDVSLTVGRHWMEGAPPELYGGATSSRRLRVPVPESWGNDGGRVMKLERWAAGPVQPQPWLVNVGGVEGTPVEWYLDGVRQFFRAVVGEVGRDARPGNRPKPLVALPLVGTGQGGAHEIKGEVVRALLGVLYDVASHDDLDVVLVTHTGPAFAAAQSARKQYLQQEVPSDPRAIWNELDDGLLGRARNLARHASSARLVLFLGAGVSVGAGFPTWSGLLKELAGDAGLSEREQGALQHLPSPDQARIIEGRLATRGVKLGERIAERLATERYSLAHALLAALPVNEVVTLNYDVLFEVASAAAGHDVAVLPYQAVSERGRWLLKMHGSITHPDDIVLTREDYLRYAERRAALAGIVQALLITRHMLFVGFSLTDDNFHRIADDVRKAIRGPSHERRRPEPFGTALLLFEDRLMEELWRGDLHCVSMTRRPSSVGEAARQLEVFLDILLSETASNAAHLLDEDYLAVLTGEERILRDRLRRFETSVPESVRRSLAWQPIGELLERLGYRSPSRC